MDHLFSNRILFQTAGWHRIRSVVDLFWSFVAEYLGTFFPNADESHRSKDLSKGVPKMAKAMGETLGGVLYIPDKQTDIPTDKTIDKSVNIIQLYYNIL